MMIPKAYSATDLAQRRRAPIGWFFAVVRLPVSSIQAHARAPAPAFSVRDRAYTCRHRTCTGDCHAFSLDRGFDYLRHRRNLLLGHRQVCQRVAPGRPAQAIGGVDLPGVDPSAGAAARGNQRDVADAGGSAVLKVEPTDPLRYSRRHFSIEQRANRAGR